MKISRSMIARGSINIRPHNNRSIMKRKRVKEGALVLLIEDSIKLRFKKGLKLKSATRLDTQHHFLNHHEENLLRRSSHLPS